MSSERNRKRQRKAAAHLGVEILRLAKKVIEEKIPLWVFTDLCRLNDLANDLEDDLAYSNCRLTKETLAKLWKAHELRNRPRPVPWKEIARRIDADGAPRSLERVYSSFRHALEELAECHPSERRAILSFPRLFIAINDNVACAVRYNAARKRGDEPGLDCRGRDRLVCFDDADE